MVFLLLVSVLFRRLNTAVQLKHNKLMSPQGPHFSPCSTAKTNNKSTNLRKNGIFGISDAVTASVYLEKSRLKKLMMMMKVIIIFIRIMNKSQEMTVFHGRQKLTSAMKQRQEK